MTTFSRLEIIWHKTIFYRCRVHPAPTVGSKIKTPEENRFENTTKVYYNTGCDDVFFKLHVFWPFFCRFAVHMVATDGFS